MLKKANLKQKGFKMEAVVTFKAKPAEFDVIREGLTTAREWHKRMNKADSATSEERREHFQKAAQIDLILEKLR